MNKNVIIIIVAIIAVVGGILAVKTIQENNTNNNVKNQEQGANIIGYWFTPHAAMENITFNQDNTFVYNHYNVDSEKEEILTGTYNLDKTNLVLTYSDGKKEELNYAKGEGDDKNYYIQNADKSVYLVKGEANL